MNRPPNFNRLAGVYRWMEFASFGPWLGRCRCAFLADASACRRAIVLGDGDGRFTARLLASNSAVKVDAVDASSAMLSALIRRAGPSAVRVRPHLADARLWPSPAPGNLAEQQPFDLIATHFFLDCLTTEEVRALATRLRRTVSPAALWLVSDFTVPPGWFGRLLARPLVGALYLAFAWMTGLTIRRLPDHVTALAQSGFILRKRRTWLGGLLISEMWAVYHYPIRKESGMDGTPND